MYTEIEADEFVNKYTHKVEFRYADYKHDDFDFGKFFHLIHRLRNSFSKSTYSYGLWIAGGFLRRLICGEPVGAGDIDIWRSRNIFPFSYDEIKSDSRWAYTLKVGDFNVQLIKKEFTSPRAIFNVFDFSCCMFYSNIFEDINVNGITINCASQHIYTLTRKDPTGRHFSYRVTHPLQPTPSIYFYGEDGPIADIKTEFSAYEDALARKLIVNKARTLNIFPNRFVKYLHMGMVPSCDISNSLLKQYLKNGTEYANWKKVPGIRYTNEAYRQ